MFSLNSGNFFYLIVDFVARATYNNIHQVKEEQKMAKKSVTPSIRMNEEDYLQFKDLKEKYNISWTKFIEYASELIEEDMKKNGH